VTDDAITKPTEADCPHCKGLGRIQIPPWVETVEAYYFGCIDDAGHYWFDRYYQSVSRKDHILCGRHIDTGFCPGMPLDDRARRTRPEKVGEAALHHVGRAPDNWTVLAWWDRSVDTRGNSNSNIVVRGTHDYPVMIAVANAQFERVMKRQVVELTLVEDGE